MSHVAGFSMQDPMAELALDFAYAVSQRGQEYCTCLPAVWACHDALSRADLD